nr:hypothetical protein BaRGS_006922 [Batillaria attramentaria]
MCVGSGGVKDATSGLRSGDDDDDFKRHDLDPPSRAVLEEAYSRHKEFYRLNSTVLDEGALLKQDVLDIYRKSGETFSYEQLLQGMLVDGEMLLLGGCWLHYMHVEFKDETGQNTVRQPYGRGRLCLTSQRVLLLSADIYTDADLHSYGDPTKDGGYKLEVSKRSAVVFRNLPLTCFHSADLEVNIGTSAQTKITARSAPCCGLCACFAVALHPAHDEILQRESVTLARAIELKHSSGLIAALAYETAQLYTDADSALSSLDEKIAGKWRKYCQLKLNFYTACAHSYNGETLLAQDKCGEAIRGLQEAVKMYDKAEQLCKEYATAKGTGTTARPQNHLFFRKLGPVVKRTLEKCDRENGLIYHQKVAYDPPHLELRATYGLVSPEEYQNPSLNPLWTPDAYSKFDVSRAPKPEKKKADDKPPSLAPVKEKETPMSDKDPKNVSGCVLS